MELQLELEHARGSSEKEQPRENYRLPRDGNAQVRRLRRGVRHRPHAANPWICGLPKSKQGGSKKSWRKSTSAKGSTPTESNCRTESYLGIYRQRRLVRKVLFLFVLSFPPSHVRYARYHRTGIAHVQQVFGGLRGRNARPTSSGIDSFPMGF